MLMIIRTLFVSIALLLRLTIRPKFFTDTVVWFCCKSTQIDQPV
jgi:hypothetical protein